jgi:carbonic anhydrase
MTASMNRRRLLRGAFAFAAACPLCTTGARADDWGYSGSHAPKYWSKLSPEFQACSAGTMQTPVDLRATVTGAADSVTRSYQKMPLNIVNNGHTIQVNAAPGSFCTIDGEKFELVQFHIHHPSEHLLAGKTKPLEIHYVHQNAAGALGVLGVFYAPGSRSLAAFEPIWAAMPKAAGPARDVAGVTIDPGALFPASGRHFRYQGSLTTPPCSEGVTWVVYTDTVETARAQIVQFAQLFPNNARPVQPLNRRSLLLAG